jgi:hypothetical protein
MRICGPLRHHPPRGQSKANLIARMFPLAAMKILANFRSTVMAGLDPAIQS